MKIEWFLEGLMIVVGLGFAISPKSLIMNDKAKDPKFVSNMRVLGIAIVIIAAIRLIITLI